MAELLIRAFDSPNDNPGLDKLAWKIGHLIDVKPDNYAWSPYETMPKHYIVKVPTMPIETATEYLLSIQDDTNPHNPVEIGIRKYKFNLNALPASLKKILDSTGIITIDETRLKSYMARIEHGR